MQEVERVHCHLDLLAPSVLRELWNEKESHYSDCKSANRFLMSCNSQLLCSAHLLDWLSWISPWQISVREGVSEVLGPPLETRGERGLEPRLQRLPVSPKIPVSSPPSLILPFGQGPVCKSGTNAFSPAYTRLLDHLQTRDELTHCLPWNFISHIPAAPQTLLQSPLIRPSLMLAAPEWKQSAISQGFGTFQGEICVTINGKPNSKSSKVVSSKSYIFLKKWKKTRIDSHKAHVSNVAWKVTTFLRATSCNHRESPDDFNFSNGS